MGNPGNSGSSKQIIMDHTLMIPASITLVAMLYAYILNSKPSSGWGDDIMAFVKAAMCLTAAVTSWVVWAALKLFF
jgi:hypothetical protein